MTADERCGCGVARGGPNDANQCKRRRASRAPCRPHASRVAALVMRRARRPCSACTWVVCVTGKDIAPVAEQTLQHASSSATNSARIIFVAQLALGGEIWRQIGLSAACASAASFSATARNDHWAARSIVWMPTTAITGEFIERSGVLVPYRTLAFLLRRNRCFCSHFSRKLVICASNPPRDLLSAS